MATETILNLLEIIGTIAITYAAVNVLYEAARFLKTAADCLQGKLPLNIFHRYETVLSVAGEPKATPERN